MIDEKMALVDIADELLIINKCTIDTLMRLDNCADCIALYVFYYKTAKWQKTNQIKANDTYVKKSLKWGRDKISKTKTTLKEHGLIDIVQERKDGKISGWYIKVSYIVQKRKIEDCPILIDSKNTQNQQVAESTGGEEEINALKEKIKCLNKELEMLKKNNTSTDVSDSVSGAVSEIIDYLNMRLGTSYKKTTKATKDAIKARLNENFTIQDFKVVIDKKCVAWANDSKMARYLRPQTLFGNKFEAYLNEPVNRQKTGNDFLDLFVQEDNV